VSCDCNCNNSALCFLSISLSVMCGYHRDISSVIKSVCQLILQLFSPSFLYLLFNFFYFLFCYFCQNKYYKLFSIDTATIFFRKILNGASGTLFKEANIVI
jgi:hypothetical protein